MKKYECITCKRTATIEENDAVPECCGKPMKQMPREICLQPAHAEHARPMHRDEPCDDFRAG
jgi:hypothetical protein